jgi:putative ABC transport system ATP-binding protein
MKIMHDLHDNGNTIILITHDNNIAMQADRVIRIIDGQISEDREVS